MYFKQNYLSTIICLSLFALLQVSCAVRVLDKETITGGDRGELVVMDSKGVPLNVDPGDTVIIYENDETVYSPTNTVHLYLYHDEMPGSGGKPAPIRRRKLEVRSVLSVKGASDHVKDGLWLQESKIMSGNAGKIYEAVFETSIMNYANAPQNNIVVRQRLPDNFTPETVSIFVLKPLNRTDGVPFSMEKDARGNSYLIVKGVTVNKPGITDYNATVIITRGKYKVPEIKKGPSGK